MRLPKGGKAPGRSRRPTDRCSLEVAAKRGRLRAMQESPRKAALLELERVKASVRARVEQVFQIVKHRFRHRKARYRGLAKNRAQLRTLFALANLVLAKDALLAAAPA